MIRRIAITQRVIENQSYPDRRDALSQDWNCYFERLLPDAALIPVPNSLGNPAAWLEASAPSALVLSNGNDWGEAPERDRTETELYRIMAAQGRPVLGVCRGLQAINAMEGGAIVTDILSDCSLNHVACDHMVDLVEDNFRELAGTSTLTVNSYHNQGVDLAGLANGLRPFAVGKQELVEGLFHPQKAVIGIQWHPERADPAAAFDEILIRLFLERGVFWG